MEKILLPEDLKDLVKSAKSFKVARKTEDLVDLCLGDSTTDEYTVSYDIPGQDRSVDEVVVCRVKNGISANYTEAYMRRRDPNCMYIADDKPTNKRKYSDAFGEDFGKLRGESFEWLKGQDLIAFPFIAGNFEGGLPSFAIAPANAAFFAFGLALLQGMADWTEFEKPVEVKACLLVAPPFRHTHFEGKQAVIHNRTDECYEIFAYNLYPGPSAKKGIYGVLINEGEREGWVAAHSSVVQVRTPYDNTTTIMHEGASGGGKSEMCEHIHREADGTLLLGRNTVTNEKINLALPKTCALSPASDDMTLCHPAFKKDNGKLNVQDGEYGWFLRVDHITNYGTDPDLESRSVHPNEPLLFLNIDAKPGGSALLWDHTMDEPGKPCPNPRFVLPRKHVPGVVTKPISVDIRSFGVRTPVCTADKPGYGILGLFHVLPPALAWLWRLVSPRGHANPSIVSTEGMQSEGVGSYWPFATGLKANQANLLLNQVLETPKVDYTLSPVKHVGAWEIGFSSLWTAREYLSRRGSAKFLQEELTEARSSLLGYALERLTIEGQNIPKGMLQVDKQPEVGTAAYDKGAKELQEYFQRELKQHQNDLIDPLGRKIIECCMDGGSLKDYVALIPHDPYMED